MTKAATEGAKRRRRAARGAQDALQGDCQISGVSIAASRDASVALSQSDTEALLRAQDRICAAMGWPADDEHRAKTRDQRIATLYGRLCLAGRISLRACRGLERWEQLVLDYRREILGADAPSSRDRAGVIDTEERAKYLARLKSEHAAVEALWQSWRPAVRYLVSYVMDPNPSEWRAPQTFHEAQCEAIDACGVAMADHFGLDE